MRHTNQLETIGNDLRYAIRTLGRSPGFTVVIVLTLALAIGANSAIFSVIQGVLLRPLPYARPDRIVRIFFNSDNFPEVPVEPLRSPRFPHAQSDLRQRGRHRPGRRATLRRRRARHARRHSASPAGYFRVLGFTPARGREFTTSDEIAAQGPAGDSQRPAVAQRVSRPIPPSSAAPLR